MRLVELAKAQSSEKQSVAAGTGHGVLKPRPAPRRSTGRTRAAPRQPARPKASQGLDPIWGDTPKYVKLSESGRIPPISREELTPDVKPHIDHKKLADLKDWTVKNNRMLTRSGPGMPMSELRRGSRLMDYELKLRRDLVGQRYHEHLRGMTNEQRKEKLKTLPSIDQMISEDRARTIGKALLPNVKSFDDKELRNARNTSAVGAGFAAGSAGLHGAMAGYHARNARMYGEVEADMRRLGRPHMPMAHIAQDVEHSSMRKRKYNRKMALAMGGIAGASAGVAGLGVHRSRKAHREMRERGL